MKFIELTFAWIYVPWMAFLTVHNIHQFPYTFLKFRNFIVIFAESLL
jgi:hypothetical protein